MTKVHELLTKVHYPFGVILKISALSMAKLRDGQRTLLPLGVEDMCLERPLGSTNNRNPMWIYGGTQRAVDPRDNERSSFLATPGLRCKIPLFSDPAPGKS